jgi:MFS family permease
LAVVGLGVAGISNPITNGPLMAVMQSTVPPEMLGRVNAMLHSLSSAMMPLGMAVAGPLSDAMGVRFWFVMGGVVCLGMGLAGLFMPAVVHLEDGRAAELEPSPAALT